MKYALKYLFALSVLLSSCEKREQSVIEQKENVVKSTKVENSHKVSASTLLKEGVNFSDPKSVKNLNEKIGTDIYGVYVFDGVTGANTLEVYKEVGIDKAVRNVASSENGEFDEAYNKLIELDPYYDKVNGCLESLIGGIKGFKQATGRNKLNSDLDRARKEIVNLLNRILELADGEKENLIKVRMLRACSGGVYAPQGIDVMNRDLKLQIKMLEEFNN